MHNTCVEISLHMETFKRKQGLVSAIYTFLTIVQRTDINVYENAIECKFCGALVFLLVGSKKLQLITDVE